MGQRRKYASGFYQKHRASHYGLWKKKMYIYRRDKEGDPAHHDKHGGGEVDGEDEGAQ